MPSTSLSTAAPLRQTLWVPLLGTLIWLGPMWLLTIVGNAIALWAVARWGSMDESLWLQGAAGWQRWPLAAAGFMIVSIFLPMFVTYGSTRRRLAHSAVLSMGVIVTLATLIITLGFFAEGFVFDGKDWTQALGSQGGRTVDEAGMASIAAGFLLGLTAWFLGGWILAVGVYRLGWFGLVPFFILGMIPVAIVEFLVLNSMDATQFDFLDSLGTPSWWIGIPASIAVLALATLGVTRAMREIEVE